MAQPSLRRRDGHSRLDDDYASDDIYGRNPPYWEAGEGGGSGQPRRHQSERRRPRASPPEYSGSGSSRRHRDDGYARPERNGGRDRRPRSPPRESRRGDSRREPRSSRYERDYPSREPASARHTGRGYTSDDEPRRTHRRTQTEGVPHRPRYASPDPKPRGGRGRDYPSPPSDDRHARRGAAGARGSSPVGGARPRGRDYVAGGAGADGIGRDKDMTKAYPRPRSHDRSPARGRPPPANGAAGTRPAAAGARPSAARRNSMPASTKAKWWQNPLLQAGARTAFTAGAQAAMQSRNSQGDWVGAKGAKVASAAIGAALMDGFANRNGNKNKDAHDDRGGRDRSRDRSRDRDRDHDRDRRGGGGGRDSRGGGGGGGGSTRDKLLREGFNFVAKRAMDSRR